MFGACVGVGACLSFRKSAIVRLQLKHMLFYYISHIRKHETSTQHYQKQPPKITPPKRRKVNVYTLQNFTLNHSFPSFCEQQE